MNMNPKPVAVLVLAIGSLLLGCEKPSVGNSAQTAPPVAAPPAPADRTAEPAGDPSVPPADTALQKPKSATDATADTELTRRERDKSMPLPGQANDHSNPEFAKRGDDRTPAKSEN